jgi:hypothetical protein
MGYEFSSKITQSKSRKKKKDSLVKEKTFTVSASIKKITNKLEAENLEAKIEALITKESGQDLLD